MYTEYRFKSLESTCPAAAVAYTDAQGGGGVTIGGCCAAAAAAVQHCNAQRVRKLRPIG